MQRKFLCLFLCLAMVLGMVQVAGAAMEAGTFTVETPGHNGTLKLEVTLGENRIESVTVTEHTETPGIGTVAIEQVTKAIVENQTLEVDTVSGATITSRAILRGVEKILDEHGPEMEPVKPVTGKTTPEDVNLTADVVIIAGGGAGLSAAVTAISKGQSVILVEKMGFLGGNSIVAGGIYNCPDPELQDHAEVGGHPSELVEKAIAEEPVSDEHKALMEEVKAEYEAFKTTDKTLFDSPAWFALQTWNGGDKIGNLKVVRTMTDHANEAYQWLKSLGMEFENVITHGAGSLYPRTHQAVKPNGVGYIDAFNDALASAKDYTLLMNTEAKSLVVTDGRVTGVEAVTRDGGKVTLTATKGVVLATGGFAGNVDLRVKYCQGEKWPYLGDRLVTSNVAGVTGDGIFMAEAVGANLVNMEQIQLLHICNPQTGATFDINRTYSNAIFVNKEGKRFVREDGRRDDMSKAILAQTDSVMHMVLSSEAIPDPATSITLGGQTVQYMVENNRSGYVMADSLEELAEKIGVPADALKATVDAYNAAIDGAEDEVGRVTFGEKILTAPFYSYPRSPAAHHTMGGVEIDTQCHVISTAGEVIPGLYAAGEITGVVHGGNRLGGNAIVDFTVFGKIAAESLVADNP